MQEWRKGSINQPLKKIRMIRPLLTTTLKTCSIVQNFQKQKTVDKNWPELLWSEYQRRTEGIFSWQILWPFEQLSNFYKFHQTFLRIFFNCQSRRNFIKLFTYVVRISFLENLLIIFICSKNVSGMSFSFVRVLLAGQVDQIRMNLCFVSVRTV